MAHTPRLSYGHQVYHDAGRDHIGALDGLDGAFEATLAGPVRTTSELVQQQALFARVRCSDLFRLANDTGRSAGERGWESRFIRL